MVGRFGGGYCRVSFGTSSVLSEGGKKFVGSVCHFILPNFVRHQELIFRYLCSGWRTPNKKVYYRSVCMLCGPARQFWPLDMPTNIIETLGELPKWVQYDSECRKARFETSSRANRSNCPCSGTNHRRKPKRAKCVGGCGTWLVATPCTHKLACCGFGPSVRVARALLLLPGPHH